MQQDKKDKTDRQTDTLIIILLKTKIQINTWSKLNHPSPQNNQMYAPNRTYEANRAFCHLLLVCSQHLQSLSNCRSLRKTSLCRRRCVTANVL